MLLLFLVELFYVTQRYRVTNRPELVRQLGHLPIFKQRKTHLTKGLISLSFLLIRRLKEVFSNTVFISALFGLLFLCALIFLMIPSCWLCRTQGSGVIVKRSFERFVCKARCGLQSEALQMNCQVAVLAMLLASCVTLGKILNLGEPHLQNGNHYSAYFIGRL